MTTAAAPIPLPSRTRRRHADTRAWLLAADVLAIFAGTLLAISLRNVLLGVPLDMPLEARISRRGLFVVFNIILLLRLGLLGQYDRGRRFSRIDDLLALARAAFIAASVAVFLAIATKGFFTGYTEYSRAYAALGMGLPVVMLLLFRLLGHRMQESAFREGQYVARALVVGGGERAQRFSKWLSDQIYLGVWGTSSATHAEDDEEHFADRLEAELDETQPDEIVLAFDHPRADLQQLIVGIAASRGISVKVLPGVFESYQASYFQYGGTPVTTLFETSSSRFARRFKTVCDRGASLLGLLLLSPLLAAVALAIRLEDGGPALYRQPRVGLHGRHFDVLKFRSMRGDADEALARCLVEDPALAAEWEQYQKLRNDPRITRVGRVIRALSIDELPQLANVVLGDMSLVGPRPPMVNQLDHYGARFVFSQVRPGITGLWQVSGRNELSFDERIDLDVWYVENWSLWLDVTLLLKTVRVVLRGEGAY